jgi:hypothetical protein
MSTLIYWKYENYRADVSRGVRFNFNSKQSRLHTATEIGEDVFVVSGVRRESGLEIYLTAHLIISGKSLNPDKNKYGKYRIVADQRRSRFFSLEGEAMTPILSILTSIRHFGDRIDRYAQSFQTLRKLNDYDSEILKSFANSLPPLKQNIMT